MPWFDPKRCAPTPGGRRATVAPGLRREKGSRSRPGLAEIHSFHSHPDIWGSGIATALMTGTLRLLRDDGFHRVHLWTLRDIPRSRRFYAKCGFAESGATRPCGFGDGNPLEQVEYERSC
ncbi:GNAT family N-acetyltransferase [Streptomyces sp. NPDC002164]|uniref:GNAT family N-acetyltransferase n=1 Tax=Streptomyces sp. NPDC002164 TaxID=3364633 RepID=UPI0036A2620C